MAKLTKEQIKALKNMFGKHTFKYQIEFKCTKCNNIINQDISGDDYHKSSGDILNNKKVNQFEKHTFKCNECKTTLRVTNKFTVIKIRLDSKTREQLAMSRYTYEGN